MLNCFFQFFREILFSSGFIFVMSLWEIIAGFCHVEFWVIVYLSTVHKNILQPITLKTTRTYMPKRYHSLGALENLIAAIYNVFRETHMQWNGIPNQFMEVVFAVFGVDMPRRFWNFPIMPFAFQQPSSICPITCGIRWISPWDYHELSCKTHMNCDGKIKTVDN